MNKWSGDLTVLQLCFMLLLHGNVIGMVIYLDEDSNFPPFFRILLYIIILLLVFVG